MRLTCGRRSAGLCRRRGPLTRACLKAARQRAGSEMGRTLAPHVGEGRSNASALSPCALHSAEA
eukprot:936409-Pleurochrysis_carterae.AAC.2